MTFENIVEIVAALLAIAVGIGGAPAVVQALKTWLRLEGPAAMALSVAVAVLFGVATELVKGAITQESFTADNAGLLILTVWTASQVQYNRIKNGTPAEWYAIDVDDLTDEGD